jgi:hypothetical protein
VRICPFFTEFIELYLYLTICSCSLKVTFGMDQNLFLSWAWIKTCFWARSFAFGCCVWESGRAARSGVSCNFCQSGILIIVMIRRKGFSDSCSLLLLSVWLYEGICMLKEKINTPSTLTYDQR